MAEPKVLGTLIVVVGKARNLPNKSRFGKQDPFCSVQVGGDKQKTKPIKRGGQHPEWDEELRFSIMEDVDDMLAAAAAQSSLKGKKDDLPPLPNEPGVVTPATLASSARKSAANTPKKKKTSKSMTISCYADDPKEPELIGEAVVVLDEVLRKGESDEWYEFMYKDKYSGEVYLELTFYSNAAPPVKRNVPRPNVYNNGSPAPARPGIPTSVSVTGMNLYIPPYQQPGRSPSPAPGPPSAPGAGAPQRLPSQMTASNSFAELGLPPRASSMAQPGQQDHSINSRPGSMMSMSLGPGSRPNNAPPYDVQTLQGPGSHHRHSFATNSQPPAAAPWAPLLPQNQGPPQHTGSATPLPRPISSVDIAGRWSGAQSTPPQRPVSSNSAAMPSQQEQPGHHRTGSVNLGVPAPYTGGIPPSSSYGNLPRPPTIPPLEPYRAGSPQPPQQQFPPYRQPSPQPPQQQYPPRVPSPQPPQQQYPPRVPSPQPPQQQFPQRQPSPQPQHYQQQMPYTPPPQGQESYGRNSGQYGQPQNAYQSPVQQPQQPYQQHQHSLPHTPQQPGSAFASYNSPATPSYQPGHQRNNSLGHVGQQRNDSMGNPQYQSPGRNNSTGNMPYSSPSQGQPPPATSTGTYVPWYMQTQPNTQSPNQQHANVPNYPGQNQQHNQYTQVPQPPNPPPPPRQGVGYYPSDELYVGQQQQQQQQYQAQSSSYSAPPVPPRYNQPQQPPQDAPYSNWNNNQYSQPQQSSTLAYAQQDAPASWNNPARVPSPLPQAPEPRPPGGGAKTNSDWRSYLAGIGSPVNQTQSLNTPPPVPQRAASPGRYGAQADWYTPPPNVPPSIANGQWQR